MEIRAFLRYKLPQKFIMTNIFPIFATGKKLLIANIYYIYVEIQAKTSGTGLHAACGTLRKRS